ncbi:MAG: MJ1477/TM1410 family putative glycoside hydrolase [Hyphomicrobium sp.]
MGIELMTADGARSVRHWGYRLQGGSRKAKSRALSVGDLARAPHDLIVMDFSRDGSDQGAFSEADIQLLKSRPDTNSVVVAYISIGEASDYRGHWQDAWTDYDDPEKRAAGVLNDASPAWLGAWNEKWPASRKVRYWDKDWQDIIFNTDRTGWLDRIVAAGFDGAYLDIVLGYYHWASEVSEADRRPGDPETEREAAARMIDFITAMAAHARETNPEFLIIPQNGAFIIDALEDEDHPRRDAYLETISAIACEDLFYRGEKDENNAFEPDADAIDALERDFIDSGKPVLSVDYVSDKKKIAKYFAEAASKRFLPYAAPSRELNILGPRYEGEEEGTMIA